MHLTATIESAERQYKQILEGYFIGIYDDKSLSSHGIDHHRRVWNYASELVLLLAERNMISDPTLPFRLIIACYLHDIGMSVDRGIRHGPHGKELCIRFLEKNNLEKTDYHDVLTAIEDHDNKEYNSFTGKYDLLSILSVADDLDAFGFTGIYRYPEIYLARGVNHAEIGNLIMENAGKRFDNFTKTFGFSEELFNKHKNRYDTLVNFFDEYNKEVSSYQFGNQQPTGYCGVIEIINEIVTKKTTLKSILNGQLKNSSDKIFSMFINGLISDSVNCSLRL
jgi:hypothetical protein